MPVAQVSSHSELIQKASRHQDKSSGRSVPPDECANLIQVGHKLEEFVRDCDRNRSQ
jgi:hypothetical protein